MVLLYRLQRRTRSISTNPGGGAVLDADGKYVDSHKVFYHDVDSKHICIPQCFDSANETVVFGGFLNQHYGHFVVESLSRMWYFLENPACIYKFVFIALEGTWDNIPFLEFFEMLGLKRESIVILKKPTRFDKIIVPEQTVFFYSYNYKSKVLNIYNAIRDSVPAADYKKVYFTQTQYERSGIIGEKYFEDYYRKKGYEVISPEKLTVKEKVMIMAGAKEFATTNGSSHHHILFAHDGIKVTILNRYSRRKDDYLYPVMRMIDYARNADSVYVDVSMNFLPFALYNSTYLIAPTSNWKAYISDYFGDCLDDDAVSYEVVVEYMSRWFLSLTNTNVHLFRHFGQQELALIDCLSKFIKYMGTELDAVAENKQKRKLKSTFDRRQKILYGAGSWGGHALHAYGPCRVYAFADTKKHGTEHLGKPVIHPAELASLSARYEIIICAAEFAEMTEFLKIIGVEEYQVYHEICVPQ